MIIPVAADKIAGMSRAELIKAYEAIGFAPDVAAAYTTMLGKPESETLMVTMKHAREVADQIGDAEFTKAVEAAEEKELSTVIIERSLDTNTINLVQPSGVLVAWFVPDENYINFEVQGGVDGLHVSLVYLGNASEFSVADQRNLIGLTAEVLQRHHELRGVVGGTQVFENDNGNYWVANVAVEGLAALQSDLVQAYKSAGLPVDETHQFVPHMTLAKLNGTEPPAVEFAPTPIYMGRITVAIAGLNFDLPLPELDSDEREALGWDKPLVEWDDEKRTPYIPIVKSLDEKRFTLAPVYVPMTKDAHGDWATADDLQQAMWDFSRGEKHIAVQHNKSLTGGEAVEFMTIPWEHEVDMPNEDGTVRKVKFPAGTPWLGVIWSEDTWPLVKAGKIRGYSIGGHASMLNVDMED